VGEDRERKRTEKENRYKRGDREEVRKEEEEIEQGRTQSAYIPRHGASRGQAAGNTRRISP
jgi:hypothetical protein